MFAKNINVTLVLFTYVFIVLSNIQRFYKIKNMRLQANTGRVSIRLIPKLIHNIHNTYTYLGCIREKLLFM